MEKKKLTLDESKNKIKFMMNYDSSKTMTEQVVPSNPSWGGINTATTAPGMTGISAYNSNELTEPLINSYARRLKRNYARIDSIMKQIVGKTYKGKPAIEGIKAAYKARTGKDLPSTTPATAPVQPPVNTAATPTPQESYRPSQGTTQDPYVPGTMGDGIGQVQEYLKDLKVDSMFGSKTQAKLAEKVPQFKDKFTKNDIITIYKTLYPQAPINPIAGTNKMPNLAPQVNTSQLASPPASETPTD